MCIIDGNLHYDFPEKLLLLSMAVFPEYPIISAQRDIPKISVLATQSLKLHCRNLIIYPVELIFLRIKNNAVFSLGYYFSCKKNFKKKH